MRRHFLGPEFTSLLVLRLLAARPDVDSAMAQTKSSPTTSLSARPAVKDSDKICKNYSKGVVTNGVPRALYVLSPRGCQRIRVTRPGTTRGGKETRTQQEPPLETPGGDEIQSPAQPIP